MKILNNTFIDCDNCGNFIVYSNDDIKYNHELHNDSNSLYSYKIKYIECDQCGHKIILDKLKISPGT